MDRSREPAGALAITIALRAPPQPVCDRFSRADGITLVLEIGMENGTTAKAPIGKRVAEELKEFLLLAVYLYICFTALAYLKAAILQAHGVEFAPFGFAAIKALICAKFMSIGHALRLGERYKKEALIWPTLHRSVVFVALLLVLNILEELIVGYLHHRAAADSLGEIGGGTVHQFIATLIIMLLILIPFFAFRSLSEVVGKRILLRLFFEPRNRSLDDRTIASRGRS
jgi:hypothetical protein